MGEGGGEEAGTCDKASKGVANKGKAGKVKGMCFDVVVDFFGNKFSLFLRKKKKINILERESKYPSNKKKEP